MRLLALVLSGLISLTAQAESWRFALIGDTPYNDYERRQLPAMIEAIGSEDVDFIVHIGDFKHSKQACSDALFEDRRQLFDASPAPFVYVPGDNEWTDCDRLPAGHYQPTERLARLRQLFMAGNESLGRRRIALQRQPGEYREHQRWRVGPVLFISLNVPGGNNNFLKSGQPSAESLARDPRVLAWLHEGFSLARQEKLAGIVILMQANPGIEHFNLAMAHGGYRQLLNALRDETMEFPGQVLLVHGDTHWHRIDHPLRHPATAKPLDNFTRVETYGYPFMGWVKGFVDSDDPKLFRFESRVWPEGSRP